MTELYLVRHGETEWNRQRRIQGRTDVPLNETGRAQARAVGRVLTRRRWDAVLTSPLSRARETAEIIAEELGLPTPEILEAAMERDYGVAEGLDFTQIEARFPDGRGRGEAGGESRDDVATRIVPALLGLAAKRPGQALVIVSHGGAIRSVLSATDPSQAHEVVSNTSVHSFRVVDGTLHLIAFNDPIEAETIGAPSSSLEFQNAVEAQEYGDA